MKDQWQGTLVLVGQPAEEMILGAQAMVIDGLWTDGNLPKPDYCIAMHTRSCLPPRAGRERLIFTPSLTHLAG